MPEIAAPMTGMNAPKKTSRAMPDAKGTPRIAAPRPMPAASTAATTSVARVNDDSWVHAMRPEECTFSRAPRGKSRTTQPQMTGPS